MCGVGAPSQGTSLSQTHKDMSFGDTSHRAHSPGGGTHFVRVMGRLRGIDPPFSRQNLDFRPPFFKVPAKKSRF